MVRDRPDSGNDEDRQPSSSRSSRSGPSDSIHPDAARAPEWMLEIMHERAHARRRGRGGRPRVVDHHHPDHDQSCDLARPTHDLRDAPTVARARDDPTPRRPDCRDEPVPDHDDALSLENASNSFTRRRGEDVAASAPTGSSSSGASSSGFSSRASGSSVTSDSSVTTFSVSSHPERDDKDRANEQPTRYSWSRRACERDVESSNSPRATASLPLGLGLYHDDEDGDGVNGILATTTPASPGHPLHSRYCLSPTRSRSPSVDQRAHSREEATEGGGGRDSTLVPASSSPRAGSDDAAQSRTRSHSPTPSCSTLTNTLPLPTNATLARDVATPHDTGSVVGSIKGKEWADPTTSSTPTSTCFPPPRHVVVAPSPPHSTITLATTTTTLSEIGTDNDEDEDDSPTTDKDDSTLLLYPPENFAIVVPGVFRSSFPRKKNFEFLKSLKLKSILTLIQDEYPQENLDFLKREGIQLFQFPIPGNKEPFVHIPDDKIVAAMQVLLDSRNHPLLVHCNKGKHRTGCLIGVLRRLQTWSLTAIFDEYRRYSHPKSRQMDLQFIEAFKGLDLVWDLAGQNRPHLPPWASTTPYSTPQRGKVPVEAKTKERSSSRAPSGRSSPVASSSSSSSGEGGLSSASTTMRGGVVAVKEENEEEEEEEDATEVPAEGERRKHEGEKRTGNNVVVIVDGS